MPTLTLAHSPDPDDLFMWWPLGSSTDAPAFDTAPFRFAPLAEDIQVLNRRAIERADLDITAISIHAYPHVRARYRLTDCAASFGESYGPKIVVRADSDAPHASAAAHARDERRLCAANPVVLTDTLRWLADPAHTIVVPGVNTTAFLVLQLMLARRISPLEAPFHEIGPLVASRRADAGLLIHDAQLTYSGLGLRELADLGAWWHAETSLPLPLGGNVVRRDLDARFGEGSLRRVAALLRRSITWALDHRDESLARIRDRYPNLDRPTLDRYLRMYVSPLTVSSGETGIRALAELFKKGYEMGLCPDPGPIDLLPCAG
jgi:1,4-dihydroxy-6-naphthoate synthase